jgi:hypothetical protein
MNRRSFFATIAGALAARKLPAAEPSEVIGMVFHRDAFSFVSPALSMEEFSARYIRPAVIQIAEREEKLMLAHGMFVQEPKIGDTITVRRPVRFHVQG